MKNKRILTILLGLAFMLTVVACGNNETGKKNNDKKAQETVQGETENDAEEEEDIKEDTEKEAGTSEAETPENTQSESTQSAVTKTTMYAKSNVNVRSGAGTSNNTIGSLTKGQEVVKIGEENGWSKIEFNGGVGYVSSKYLSTEKVSTSTANSSTANNNSSEKPPTGNTVITSTVQNPSVTECEHWYQPEFKSNTYEYVKQMVWACNGCGYPLFTIEDGKPVNFDNMYFHPACYSEKLGTDCTGGGYHSEVFHHGFCGLCHDEIVWRQCMFSEMGKTCVKNEVLGAYEKIELGQNPRAFWKSCSCGSNSVFLGQATPEGEYGGLLFIKETCQYCGDVKNYPQK